jgi:hypothetical protein
MRIPKYRSTERDHSNQYFAESKYQSENQTICDADPAFHDRSGSYQRRFLAHPGTRWPCAPANATTTRIDAGPAAQCGRLLKIARESTARFKDVSVAEAEGYSLQFDCVRGDDSGAMGLHYVNGNLVNSGVLDATRTQVVIYEPMPGGGLRLIGGTRTRTGHDFGKEKGIPHGVYDVGKNLG